MRLQIARQYGLLVSGVAHHDFAQTLLQIGQARGETEDRHHLGSDDDVEAIFSREAVGRTTERSRDLSQRAIVDVHRSPPGDAPNIEAELVAMVNVVIDHRRQQIVGESDRGEVTGEMQVDVFHRHDLRVAATGRATLHAEHRAERGFA